MIFGLYHCVFLSWSVTALPQILLVLFAHMGKLKCCDLHLKD
uniref:Uncharacterized protein n=1 Tax=Rhizophora mucronata TaxID=61149 RepID=A0A2P2PUK5_RHIMU